MRLDKVALAQAKHRFDAGLARVRVRVKRTARFGRLQGNCQHPSR
jgi:hypothetical protein